jgi:transposase
MTKGKRRKYDREFKIEAVKLVKKYLEDTKDSFPGTGHLKPQDEELRRLRKKLADAEEERDILKKALAIFSKEPK